MVFDPLTIGMLAVLAVLIFFMWRNGRKRRAEQEKLKALIQPGAKVMTNFGLFGTLVSIDELSNEAELEVSPGTVLRVHRQTIAKVVEDTESEPGQPRSVEEAMAIANREAEEREAAEKAAKDAAAPAFGERVESEESKPARRTTKKPTE